MLALLVVLATASVAEEPTVVRLSEAVGDTIDRDERDGFHLFPNTAGFERAVIFALPGPEFYVEVTRSVDGTTKRVYYPILPGQLVRIRFLIDDDPYITPRGDSRETGALTAFWWDIERKPLRSITGESVIAQEATPTPPEAVTAGEPAPSDTTNDGRPQLWPRTSENRYNCTLHGTTIGSAAGGCVGSLVGIRQVEAGGWSGGDWCVNNPIYAVNHPVFLGVSCGLTVLGSTAGYVMGAERDHARLISSAAVNEGTNWRIGCAVGAAVPGALLGIWAGYMYALLHNRVTGWIENDPKGLTMLPGAFTGLCIAVEVVTIGYQIGHAIDRRNAAKAEAKRRALGH